MARYFEVKAKQAAKKAEKNPVAQSASRSAMAYARAGGVSLSKKDKEKAVKVIQPRVQSDRSRTASRAAGIASRMAKKQVAKRTSVSTGNVAMKKKPSIKKK